MRRFPAVGRCARKARIGLALLGAGLGIAGCEAQAPPRPNLVLITVDRLAADRLACFGGPEEAATSICALGSRGTLFAWAVASGRGEASAAATVLTSLPEFRHGVHDDGQSFLQDPLRTVAEDLSDAGYATAALVASPRLNRSRRLDQGFDHYEDRFGSPSRMPEGDGDALLSALRRRIESVPRPWFLWIHADRADGLAALDRLVSRISQLLDDERYGQPGILFLALRGEPESRTSGDDGTRIGWRTHRIPLVWRPPTGRDPGADAISLRLAGLIDAAPTLRAAAGLTERPSEATEVPPTGGVDPGRDLSRWSLPQLDASLDPERFILLSSGIRGGEVGLAARRHLYARLASPLDGTGRPVPTPQLRSLDARFLVLPDHDPIRDAAPTSARLEPSPWQRDVLDAESPVSRLEFHLSRQLGTFYEPAQERREAP